MAHPETPATETTSRFHFPSAYTILFALIVIIAGLTWVIPAGQYERAASEALGKDVPVAGTYAPTDANPQGFLDVILAPIAGFYDPGSYAANAIDVALFVLMIGGFIGVVTATGAIDAGIKRAMARLEGAGKVDDPDPHGALCGGRLDLWHGRGDAGLLRHPDARDDRGGLRRADRSGGDPAGRRGGCAWLDRERLLNRDCIGRRRSALHRRADAAAGSSGAELRRSRRLRHALRRSGESRSVAVAGL
jgi:hypothetical protein